MSPPPPVPAARGEQAAYDLAVSSEGPPMFLIVAAIVATLIAVAVALLVLRSVRREQRGFEVQPPPPAPSPDRDADH